MKSIAIRLLAVAVVVTGFAAFSQSEAQACFGGRGGCRSMSCGPRLFQRCRPVCCQPVCCEVSCCETSCCDCGCRRGCGHRLFGGRRGCCGCDSGCNGGCGGCGEGGGGEAAPAVAPEAPAEAPAAPAEAPAAPAESAT